MFSRRLQYVFQKRPQDVSKRSCQDVFKTPSRKFEDVFNFLKASSRHIQDVLQKCPQNVFKRYYQVKLCLLTRLRDALNTFLKRTAKTVIYRRICLGHTSDKFMVKSDFKNLSSFSFSLYYTF